MLINKNNNSKKAQLTWENLRHNNDNLNNK